MADYLVTDTELTSVANAIRTKGGTSASLSFPTGFVSAIENIVAGGYGEVEIGEYEPTEDSTQVTVNFSRSHSKRPCAIFIGDNGLGLRTFGGGICYMGKLFWTDMFDAQIAVDNTWGANACFCYYTSSSTSYQTFTKATGAGTATTATFGCTATYAKFRAGRTYKWIAIWN